MTFVVPFLIHRERHTKVERVESHSLMVLSSCIHHCSDLVQGRHDTVNSTIHGKITEIIVRVATSPEMVTIDRGDWAVVLAWLRSDKNQRVTIQIQSISDRIASRIGENGFNFKKYECVQYLFSFVVSVG